MAAEIGSYSATDFFDCRPDLSESYQRTRDVQIEVLAKPRQKSLTLNAFDTERRFMNALLNCNTFR